ncbi:hypothetical protein TRVA0_001S09428 [Trichomonascus vanleenenianus]|uniref:uncharacterized protein n=1 Tax=Trichomonascus vanleenenianus TaxID=2268995 RepID=UPI003EC9A381
MEGFRSSAVRKSEITDPTITPAKWAELVLRTCQAQVGGPQEWKVLVVVTGLLLARNKHGEHIVAGKLRAAGEEMLVSVCGRVSSTVHHAYVAYFALAKVYTELDPSKFAKINHSEVLIGTLLLICRPDKGLNYNILPGMVASGQSSNPVFTHWSGFSHLIKACIEKHTAQDLNVLDEALNYMLDFVELLSESALRVPNLTDGSWQVLKLCLFGVMIQLQGYCSLMLTAKKRTFFRTAQPARWGYFAAKIVRCLSPIYFIVLHLSGSGFTAYDFVYYTCLDTLLDSPSRRELAHITRTLAGSTNIGSLSSSVVNRGRIVYILDFFESVVPYLDAATINRLVLPIAREFWVPGVHTDFAYFQPVLESAHSVMLAYLTTVASAAKESDAVTISLIDSLVPEYLEAILTLFPEILSPVQLNLALVSMVHVVTSPVYRTENPHMADLLMDKLLIKCHETPSGVKIPKVGDEGKQDAGQESPPTTRAVLGSALIHAIPFVEDVAKLEQWLDSVQLVIVSSGPEQGYLRNELWKMISGEVGLALADTAIRWWYSPKL